VVYAHTTSSARAGLVVRMAFGTHTKMNGL
jgi:hypothetical protein